MDLTDAALRERAIKFALAWECGCCPECEKSLCNHSEAYVAETFMLIRDAALSLRMSAPEVVRFAAEFAETARAEQRERDAKELDALDRQARELLDEARRQVRSLREAVSLEAVEIYIQRLTWTVATEDEKTLVIGNLRGFAAAIRQGGEK